MTAWVLIGANICLLAVGSVTLARVRRLQTEALASLNEHRRVAAERDALVLVIKHLGWTPSLLWDSTSAGHMLSVDMTPLAEADRPVVPVLAREPRSTQ